MTMRILPLDPANASGDALRALQSPVGGMTLFGLLARADSVVLAVMRLGAQILSKQSLDARSRELMVLLALRLENGRYEWPQHVDIAKAVGVSDDEIRAIEELAFEQAFNGRDRTLLRFARAVVENVRVDDETYAAARCYLDETQLIEAIVDIGFYMMLARLTEALEVGPDPVQGRRVLRSLHAPAE
jgi:alkylhydroperoxidase family enzyme